MHYDPDSPGKGVDWRTNQLNEVIAHLELAITQAPNWWKLDELGDVDLITRVYEGVMLFQNSFRRDNSARAGGSGEGTGQDQAQAANDRGDAGPVVVQKVPASLEP